MHYTPHLRKYDGILSKILNNGYEAGKIRSEDVRF